MSSEVNDNVHPSAVSNDKPFTGDEMAFTIAYQNVRGLNSKTVDFFHSVLLTEGEYDAIALTETWLTDSVFDSELFPESFRVLKCRNRGDDMRGGGVLLAVKKNYRICLLNLDYNVPCIDLLGAKVYLNDVNFIYVLVVYITPSCGLFERENLFSYIENQEYLYQRRMVLVGDFNISHLNNYYVNNFRNQQVDMFLNFVEFFDCRQINRVLNRNNRLLDVVVTNSKCRVYQSTFSFVEVDTHHPPLMIEIESETPRQKNLTGNYNSSNFNFRKADFDAMYQLFLNTSWNDLESLNDVNMAVELFYHKIYNILEVCVPKRKICSKIYPVYFTKQIIKDIKSKDKLRIKNKRTQNIETHNQFIQLRVKIKRDINDAHEAYLTKVQHDIGQDSRSFWQFINSKRSVVGVPNTMHLNDMHLVDGESISNAFAAYFSSVYANDLEHSDIHDALGDCQIFDALCLDQIKYEDVCDAVRGLKVNKAIGPDNIPSFVIKGMIGFLAEPLRFLFNLSLKTNTFPQVWKEAKICPVFKKGDSTDVKNYRPISLLSCPAKIFEAILYKFIYNFVKNKISARQHGFLNKKSTSSNLCEVTQYIAESLDGGSQVDVIYTDFAKAFDRISHSILIQKLYIFGFHDSLVDFFKSYLHNRPQRVVIRGYYSNYFSATSGIPQGSNLGPLLFLLFIDDLVNEVSDTEVLLFADDLKLYARVNNHNDCRFIQQNLDKIYLWSIKNKLNFNIDKCFVLSFSRKKTHFNYEYMMNKRALARVWEMRDLGVIFDTQLTFRSHINDITKRASRMYGFIVRNCKELDVVCVRTLYFSYVRSILEYCSIIWSPCYENHKCSIEKIQNKFLRYLHYKEAGLYQMHIPKLEIMKAHNIQTLERRRKVSAIIFMYKILNNMINAPDLLSQINFYAPAYRTRSPLSFYIDNTRTNYYSNSPIIVMCKLCNQIRSQFDLWNLGSVSRLKSMLNEILE